MARILVALFVAAVMQALLASAHGSRVSQAKPGQFAHQALLQVRSTDADGEEVFHLCNGALISLEWILTTNSCVNGTSQVEYTDVAVLLGVANMATDDSHTWFLYNYIDKIVASDAADLALVRLPAEYFTQTETSTVSPVRLPPKKYQNKSYLLWKATFSNYGPSSSEVPDDPIDLKKWLLQYSSARVQPDFLCRFELGREAFTDGSLCLFRSLKTLGTTCTRIAGSPLVVTESDGKLTLLGVGAGGDAAACKDAKAARFIEVAPHLDWITQTAGIALRE